MKQSSSNSHSGKDEYRFIFAVCTLVTKPSEYELCLTSFRKNGFSDVNSQFIAIDNTRSNQFDGYSGIAESFRRSSARYLIICHQDVELLNDGYDQLLERLSELEKVDPDWAVAGNAGYRGLTNVGMRITDPIVDDARFGKLPMRVDTLDENLLILNGSARLAPSSDLSGFHFYGLDLCIRAAQDGKTAYVIDFHLRHKSAGTRSPSFYEARDALERKYSGLSPGRILKTTCEIVFIGGAYRIRILRRPIDRSLRLLARMGLLYRP